MKTHKQSNTRLYAIWCKMKERCLNPNSVAYPDYGGRGIKVCSRWLRFENFLIDMGAPPPGYQIDRVNVNGNYCKDNCRWATPKENANNRRSNVWFTYKGHRYNIAQAAEKFGLPYRLLRKRIRHLGWTPEKAIETSSIHSSFKYKGQFYTYTRAESVFKINGSTLQRRIHSLGWSVRKALNTPARPMRNSLTGKSLNANVRKILTKQSLRTQENENE